jgi:hypothetical protein
MAYLSLLCLCVCGCLDTNKWTPRKHWRVYTLANVNQEKNSGALSLSLVIYLYVPFLPASIFFFETDKTNVEGYPCKGRVPSKQSARFDSLNIA